jgi:hypothetical protein
MGGVVYDGRALGRVHLGHPSFLKVLSCHFHLGDGEGRKGAGKKTVERSGAFKIGHPYSSFPSPKRLIF